ncbi:MAG: ABC transporter substrate-binding protein [Thioploca sp.]|nr:ABC transporter substrate-binding protein [Thioploca sp.]
MNKRLIYLLVVMIFAVGSTTTWAKTTIKVGYLPILDHLTLLVSHAQDNNAFKQVEIQPKLFKSWTEMVGALKAGAIDAAFILSPLAMDLFNHGLDIQTILLAHRDGSAITVKKDSSIRSAADLKGKLIAIPDQKATHTALLNHYLMTAGLSLKEVLAKVIAPPNMLKAMKLGKIDAFIVAEPFGAKAQDEGIGRILVLTKDIINNHVECIVVIKKHFLTDNPAAVQEWVDSLIRAGKWIDQDKLNNHAQQVAQLTAKTYLPHSPETIILGLQNPPDRILYSDLNPKLEDFQKIVDISKEANILEPVDLKTFIDNRFYHDSPTIEESVKSEP